MLSCLNGPNAGGPNQLLTEQKREKISPQFNVDFPQVQNTKDSEKYFSFKIC